MWWSILLFFFPFYLFIYWGILNRENMYKGAKVWGSRQADLKADSKLVCRARGGEGGAGDSGPCWSRKATHSKPKSLDYLLEVPAQEFTVSYIPREGTWKFPTSVAAKQRGETSWRFRDRISRAGMYGSKGELCNLQIKQLLGSPVKQKKKKKLVFKSMVCG